MHRFLLRFWRWLRAEIVFGFLIGSVFWAAVLGWQAAYAPADAEKQKCYDAAHNAGHKGEECKALWEKTTSDPVAFFTLVLAISTIGLWVATVFLYRAGERQFSHARRSAAIQSRDMQASIAESKRAAEAAEKSLIATNRAWIKIQIRVGGPIHYNVNGANFTLVYLLENVGNSPALSINIHPKLIDYATGIMGELTKHISLLKEFGAPRSFGYALFPGEKIEQPISVSMSKQQIEEATKLLPAIYPAVIGSVTYRTGLDDDIHQTGFAVEIQRDRQARPFTTERNYAPAAIWIEEGDVPADQVRLYRSFLEGGYAD